MIPSFKLVHDLSSARVKQEKLDSGLVIDQLEGDLRAAYPGIILFRKVDWWRHNRHLSLVIGPEKPVMGIHFSRRLRTPFITPVAVEGRDAELLTRGFNRLWVQAGVNSTAIPEQDVPDDFFDLDLDGFDQT